MIVSVSVQLRVLFIGLVLLHAALGRGPIDGTSAVSYRKISSRGPSLGIMLRCFLLFTLRPPTGYKVLFFCSQ